MFKSRSLDAIKAFGFVSLRDSKSLEIAQELGVNAIPTVDSAFLDSPKVNMPFSIRSILSGKKYMVFVPNKLTWHYKYSKVQQAIIDRYNGKATEPLINYLLKRDVTLPEGLTLKNAWYFL